MNEYEMLTQGATHNFTPPYDGRDPMRNQSYEHCDQLAEQFPHSPVIGQAIAAKIRTAAPKAVPSSVKRYSILTKYANGIGIPTMMACGTGEYVLYRDYAACLAHSDMQLALRKLADEKLADALATIKRLMARSGE